MDYKYVGQFGLQRPVALQAGAISAYSPSAGRFFGQYPCVCSSAKWLGSALPKALSGSLKNTTASIDNPNSLWSQLGSRIRAPLNGVFSNGTILIEN
ncbi:unnamed protein product [marine sediment metagenome]|uniref:Uncharacterized protein n=1 Tax=marine sediment metagenome TaxID=412755 RepID=X0S1M3_9ZZZZ